MRGNGPGMGQRQTYVYTLVGKSKVKIPTWNR